MDGEALLIASTLYARLILGGVFLWAGIAKLRHRPAFESAVADFGLVPRQFVPVVARIMPPVEVGLGIVLVVDSSPRRAAFVTLILLGAFTLATLIILIRGHSHRCFCFGSERRAPDQWTILRNVGLIMLAGFLASSRSLDTGIDSLNFQSPYPPSPVERLQAVLVLPLAATLMWLVIGGVLKYRRHQ